MALRSTPFLKLTQDRLSHLLIFHLVSMTCLFYEDQFVFISGRHMVIQISEKLGRVSIGEVVIGSDQKRPGVSDLLSLGKVAVLCSVDIVEKSGNRRLR